MKSVTLYAKHLTPATHGYAICDACGVWRPEAACHPPTPEGFTLCRDEAWCKQAAEAHGRRLNATADRPAVAPTADEPHVWGT